MRIPDVVRRGGLILCMTTGLLFCIPYARAERPNEMNGQVIKDKFQEVLDKTDVLGSHLEAMCDLDCQSHPSGQRFKEKVARMRQAHARAKKAHDRTDIKDYKELMRKRGKKKDEGCDPQMQVCLPSQGTSLLAAAEDPEFDDERGKDMVEDLDEIGQDLDELNEILAGHVPAPPPVPDVELENANYYFPSSLWPSPDLMYGAFIADQVALKLSALSKLGCNQVAVALGFGGNASAACIAVEGVFLMLDYVYQVFSYIRQNILAAEVNGTYRRTKNVFDQLVFTSGDIDGIKMVVDAMGKKMLELEENQKYIIHLLTMPQGHRPEFPKP